MPTTLPNFTAAGARWRGSGCSGGAPEASRHVAGARACSVARSRLEDTRLGSGAAASAHTRQCARGGCPPRPMRRTPRAHAEKRHGARSKQPPKVTPAGIRSRSRRRLGLVVRRVSLRALQLLLKLLRAPGRRVSTRATVQDRSPVATRGEPRRSRSEPPGSASRTQPPPPLRSGGAAASHASDRQGGHALTVQPRRNASHCEPPTAPLFAPEPPRSAALHAAPPRCGVHAAAPNGRQAAAGCAAMQP